MRMKTRILYGVVLSFFGLFIAQCTGNKTLPMEISGRWTTADQAYRGEYIELSSNKMTIGSENMGGFLYTITKVESEKGPLHKSTLFTIYCTDESGGETLFTFIFTPGDGGALRYKTSQNTVWKRA
jgi:hypothetical protein